MEFTKYQTDHALTEKIYANIMSQRGAECGSDHFMVKIVLKQENSRIKEDTNQK